MNQHGTSIVRDFQRRIRAWTTRCFGLANLTSKRERASRHVEESVELGQALGLSPIDVARIVHRVYSRPAGTADQEIAGSMLTLLALCEGVGIDPIAVTDKELNRIESHDVAHFREKHQAKVDAGTGEPMVLPEKST